MKHQQRLEGHIDFVAINRGNSSLQKVEEEGKCRFAIIPDGVVQTDKEIYDMLRTVSVDTRSFMKENMKKMIKYFRYKLLPYPKIRLRTMS